jgi:hypothetical protein
MGGAQEFQDIPSERGGPTSDVSRQGIFEKFLLGRHLGNLLQHQVVESGRAGHAVASGGEEVDDGAPADAADDAWPERCDRRKLGEVCALVEAVERRRAAVIVVGWRLGSEASRSRRAERQRSILGALPSAHACLGEDAAGARRNQADCTATQQTRSQGIGRLQQGSRQANQEESGRACAAARQSYELSRRIRIFCHAGAAVDLLAPGVPSLVWKLSRVFKQLLRRVRVLGPKNLGVAELHGSCTG